MLVENFFKFLLFLEFIVILLAMLYLLVFEGRKMLELRWKWRYPVYLLFCLWNQLSFIYCVFFFNPSNVQSNRFKWIDWDDRETRVTIFFAYYLSTRTNCRRIGLSGSSYEYVFERFTLVWRCFTISCVFGYVHVSDGITPLAFFTYASGGAIVAFLYRKNSALSIIPFYFTSWSTLLHFGNYGYSCFLVGK